MRDDMEDTGESKMSYDIGDPIEDMYPQHEMTDEDWAELAEYDPSNWLPAEDED